MDENFSRKFEKATAIVGVCGFFLWIAYSQGMHFEVLNKFNNNANIKQNIVGISIVEALTPLKTIDSSPFITKGSEENEVNKSVIIPVESSPPLIVSQNVPMPLLPNMVDIPEIQFKVKAIIYSGDNNNIAVIDNGKDEITVKEGSETILGMVDKITKNYISIKGKKYNIDKGQVE